MPSFLVLDHPGPLSHPGEAEAGRPRLNGGKGSRGPFTECTLSACYGSRFGTNHLTRIILFLTLTFGYVILDYCV